MLLIAIALLPERGRAVASIAGFGRRLPEFEAFHPGLAVSMAAVGSALAVAWYVLDRRREGPSPSRLVPVAAVGAAALVASGRLSVGAVGVVAVGVVLVAGFGLLSPAALRPDSPMVPAYLVVSMIGVWAAVPDTEPALVLGGIVVPSVVLGRCRQPAVIDRVVGIALVVLAAWSGSAGRSEIVGGLGCVGLLALPPRLEVATRLRAPTLFVVHLAVVVVSSRVVTRIV